jgi:hypothetical protein
MRDPAVYLVCASLALLNVPRSTAAVLRLSHDLYRSWLLYCCRDLLGIFFFVQSHRRDRFLKATRECDCFNDLTAMFLAGLKVYDESPVFAASPDKTLPLDPYR